MSYIPDHLVDEIRQASEIVDVISDYVTLKKRGVNYFGLCPFHGEKTPSFSVNADKQIFHCFGCSAGGNVFSFIMRHEGINFPEAARILAKRAGIEIPEPDEFDTSDAQEREALYFANELACDFFQQQLFEQAGQAALGYMHDRGFEDDGLREFGIGYAPAEWDAFLKFAVAKNMREEVLEQAGLLNRREKGGYYDRFRDRIMFPIANLSGKIVAFGGRTMSDDKAIPKYVNSPETMVYHKSNVLYGLFQARETLREADEVIFVEGYTDVMRLSLAGQKNVVATSGTALTELQARLVRRYVDKVVLLYDSDAAGAAATLRGADVLIEQGVSVQVAELADDEDPDSFVRKYGVDALREKLKAALPLLDFKSRLLPQSGDPAAKSESMHSIINTLARIQDGIERQETVRQYAEKLKIEEAILWDEISRVRKLQLRRRSRTKIEQETYLPDTAHKSFAERSKPVEEELIRIMLLHWQAIPFIFSFMELTDFYDQDLQLIATVLYQLHQSEAQPEPEDLVHYFTDPHLVEFITKVVIGEAQRQGISSNYQKWAADCLAKLQRIMLDVRIDDVQVQIRDREQSGGDASELMQRWQELQGQRLRIKPENFMPEKQYS